MRISAARLRVFATVLAACFYAGAGHAAPNNGFGVYLGALSSSDSSLYGNSHGGLVAVDAQFIVNDQWSLNPYLLLDSESTGQSFDINNGEGGLQARYWMGGSLFVGGQFLFHDTLFKRGGTVGSSLYGPGIGVAAGWESDSHWSVALAANVYRLAGVYGSAATNRSEAMLLIGYHWY
jgi:hypothetical protein